MDRGPDEIRDLIARGDKAMAGKKRSKDDEDGEAIGLLIVTLSQWVQSEIRMSGGDAARVKSELSEAFVAVATAPIRAAVESVESTHGLSTARVHRMHVGYLRMNATILAVLARGLHDAAERLDKR